MNRGGRVGELFFSNLFGLFFFPICLYINPLFLDVRFPSFAFVVLTLISNICPGLRGLVWKLGLRYVGRFGARSVCEIGLGCSVSSSCGLVENPDLLNLLYECNSELFHSSIFYVDI